MRKLTKLDLHDVALRVLPSVVGRLAALVDLHVTSATLETIPDDALPRTLAELALIRCPELVALPDAIGELSSLKRFEVIAAKITTLPRCMRRLKKLEALAIRETAQLTEIPAWIGDLAALDYLAFETCPKVAKLPESMRKLKKISTR